MAAGPRLLATLLVALASGSPASVGAEAPRDGAAGAPDLDVLPTARERVLTRLEQSAREAGVERSVIEQPIGEARRALHRAAGARAAGDGHHAIMLDSLATAWSEVASAVLRAARIEGRAAQQARRARDLRIRLERSRALLAEQQAHRWRLESEIDRALGAAVDEPAEGSRPGADVAPSGAKPPGLGGGR